MTPATPAAEVGRKSSLDSLAVGCLLVCCGLWGLTQVAAKLALAEIPPLAQAAARSLGAALLLLAWARWRGVGLACRGGSLPGGLLAGALFAGEFACIYVGLQYTSASRMAAFIYLAPFVVALGMPWIARKKRLAPSQWWGLVLAFAGVACAFGESFGAQAGAGVRQWWGGALGIAAAVLWAATTLTIRVSALARASAEKTLLYQLAVSAVLLALAAFLAGERWPAQVSPAAWALLGFQNLIISFASYLVWFWLVHHYPATRLSAFTLLTPLAGLLAGVGLLDEPLTVRLALAMAAVATGIALVNRR